MKKLYNSFLLCALCFTLLACPDPDNSTNVIDGDLPTGYIYYQSLNSNNGYGNIQKISLPVYKLDVDISNAYNAIRLSDGRFVLGSAAGLSISNKENSSSTKIIPADSKVPHSFGAFDNIAVNEEKQLIAYENTYSATNSSFANNIFIVDFNGNLKLSIMSEDGNDRVVYPEFTKDGKLLMSGHPETFLGIIEVDLESGEKKTLIEGSQKPTQVSVSPDGTKLAYIKNNNVWISNRDGSNEVLFMSKSVGANRALPKWSPDGKWISSVANNDLYLNRISDKKVIKITRTESWNYPNFSGIYGSNYCWKSN